MKKSVLNLERALLDFLPVRFLVWFVDATARRLLWLWGRIRFGALVRNRGEGCVCHWNANLKYPENISLGDGVVIGANATIGAHSPVRISHRVRISEDVIIESAGLDFAEAKPPYAHVSRPIEIDEGVWIGARAIVLGGITVGAYSIIAAGAVVTGSIPPYSIAGGIPARVIGSVALRDQDSAIDAQ
jgi:acetyltransferase-like isoleucine patch superfamily enzyme